MVSTRSLVGLAVVVISLIALPPAVAGPQIPWRVKEIRHYQDLVHRCQDALGVPRSATAKIIPVGKHGHNRELVLVKWRERYDSICGVVRAAQSSSETAIRVVFGRHAGEALRVASCESGWRPWASNGQYLGMFQMGESERALYGHGPDRLTQARAAYRYFVASGRDWSPWSCKPW